MTVCIAFPGLVVALDGADAIVEIDGRRRRASLLLHPATAVGDWVVIGAGSVLRPIDAAEAAALTQLLKAAMASTEAAISAKTPGGIR